MRKTILSCAALALLAAAPTASAADRTGTLSATSPSYTWDGGPGTSIGVNTGVIGGASVGNFVGCFDGIADCEETLIKVEVPGKLTLLADSADDSKDVLDMYLFPSNEAGEYDDSETDMAEGGGAGTTGDEKIEMTVPAGFYMVQIKFFLADEDVYKGSATLSGFPPPAGEPAQEKPAEQTQAPQQEQQAQQPKQADQPKPAAKKKSKRAACTKKAKKIKNKKKRAKALKKCRKVKG